MLSFHGPLLAFILALTLDWFTAGLKDTFVSPFSSTFGTKESGCWNAICRENKKREKIKFLVRKKFAKGQKLNFPCFLWDSFLVGIGPLFSHFPTPFFLFLRGSSL